MLVVKSLMQLKNCGLKAAKMEKYRGCKAKRLVDVKDVQKEEAAQRWSSCLLLLVDVNGEEEVDVMVSLISS